MRLLARKLSQHRDGPRHRFLGSQGLNYGWSNIFVNLCCCQPTSSGYVEGACLISAEDSQAWVNEMECVGMAIQQVPMAEAKKMLFTQAPQATLEA